MVQNNKGDIFVVDDTSVNRKLLSEMLTKNGYEVRTAKNGESALHDIFEAPPELILLDIKMPEMNGYDVCEALKSESSTEDIPVIFISALNETEDIVRGFDVGGVDYVTKPFKFPEVLARVESQLTLSRQRKQIEQMRERDRNYFETLTRMKDLFIRAATHDLKNPIALIVGYVSILREEMPDDELGSYLDGIMNGTNKMMNLITDMLDLAQMESGLELVVYEVNVCDLIRRSVETFHVQAQARNIALTMECITPLIAEMDGTRMERVLDNLISNAVKYTPDNGAIQVIGESAADCVFIHVRDNGMGIPEDAIPNLFDAFYRVREKKHMEIEGTGLGLSIVKAIVEQHEGEIYVDSVLGEGTTFTVAIPR